MSSDMETGSLVDNQKHDYEYEYESDYDSASIPSRISHNVQNRKRDTHDPNVVSSPLLPKVYTVTKYVNELYADVFSRCYGFHSTGLRYFNVFGPRQDPNGAYAAVIPKWTAAMIAGEEVAINGDGETSRDFCFVAKAYLPKTAIFQRIAAAVFISAAT